MTRRGSRAAAVTVPVIVAVTALWAMLLTAPGAVGPLRIAAQADAAPCPQAELIFARGRIEAPGAGAVGNALLAALRARTDRDIDLYAVRYPADTEVDVGANDMSARIQDMAGRCPDTRLVVGGYSLGAAVSDVALAVPIGAFGFTRPLPTGVDPHIAAVALFGNGSAWAGPISRFSARFRDRTIELCHGEDPVCNPSDPSTWQNNWKDHLAAAYVDAGLVDRAADYVAARI